MINNRQSKDILTADLATRFSHVYATHPLNSLIANAHARTQILALHDAIMPVTIVNKVRDNCYTVSPHAAIVDYGKDECDKLPPYQGVALRRALHGLSASLRLSKIDKVATFNNYCLSTNTLGRAFLTLNKKELTEFATAHFPNHAILIRSLNTSHHGDHLQEFSRLGYHLITSRQVYLFDEFDSCQHKKDYKRDVKLLNDGRFIFRTCQSEEDYRQAVHWYNRLYLQKYSLQNVQFTPKGLQVFHKYHLVDLELLIDANTNQSCGVLGVVTDDTELTAPIVGYDIDAPQSLGLYRRVIARAMLKGQTSGRRLNLSSGAPSFKLLRGGVATIEYTAVYTAHLPYRQRLPWLAFARLSPYYAKLLQHYKL
jgi:hypothetical protein